MRANGAPLRDCGALYEGETEIDECCLFYPPNKIGNGRHKHTVMSTRDAKCKKSEQYYYVAPNAYQAAIVADRHDAEQVALTRAAVADVCAGSQSVTHAMGMMGIRSVPLDERTEVDTGWGKVHNEHLELNLGFKSDPGTSACEQLREVYHSKGIALGRLTALFFSLDCKPNCMESRKRLLRRRGLFRRPRDEYGQSTSYRPAAAATDGLGAPPPTTLAGRRSFLHRRRYAHR